MAEINHSIQKQRQDIIHYAAICIVTMVYVITFLCIEKRGFWIVDNANKFLQLEAINKSNFSDFSIPWLGKSIDPNYEYNPIRPPFSVVKNNKLYSVYPPLFASISLFFYRVFSFPGLYILPLIASILILIGLARISKLIGLSRNSQNLAVLITGLCTPLWFYSAVYWEHSIVVCLCIWGILYCMRFLYTASYKYLVYCSLISACAIYFRDEVILFYLALIGALLIIKQQQRLKTVLIFSVAVIAAVIPHLFFNWITIGHPVGFRATSNLLLDFGIIKHITTRPAVFYHLFLKSSQNVLLSLLLTVPLLALFLLRLRLRRRFFLLGFSLLSILALIISLYYLYSHLFSNAPINQIYHSNSLFVVSPVLVLALIKYRNHKERVLLHMENLLWFTAVGYSLLFALATPFVTSWGIHWGNRILLLIYPLLAIFCAKNIENWYHLSNRRINWQAVVCLLTLLISISIQFYSINLLHHKKTFSRRLNQEIQDYRGNAIVTNVLWAPQDLYSVFFSKMIFYAATLDQYNQLMVKLSSKGYKEALFVTHALKETRNMAYTKVVDKRLNCFGLHFFVMDLTKKKE